MSTTSFAPSPPLKEEGRGEEAKADSSSTPLTPTLSPFGRGEGVQAAANVRGYPRHNPDRIRHYPGRAAKSFLHDAERQDDIAGQLVEHLRQPGVDGGEPADQAFHAGEMLEARAGTGGIADGEQKK